MSEAPADWDGAWKDSLTGLLPWFLAKYFPHVHADIDWSRGYEPLDQELQKIIPGAATGVLRADLLFKVWLRSGEERWVLIHIEIQAQRDPDFPERVFDYNTLIKHVFGHPVASFAILADDEPGWRPGPHAYDIWGSGGEFHFPMVKLLDFAGQEAELEKDSNPFAVVVLAHLKARETTGDRARRREWKFRLLQGLYNRGWQHDDIRQLLRTIDWFLTLPPEDNRLVLEAIEADEKEKQMPYITSFERILEERGEARGLKEGIALALEAKFGQAGKGFMAEVSQVDDIKILKRIADAIRTGPSVDDVRRACAG